MQKFSYTPTTPFSGSLSSLAIGAGMVIAQGGEITVDGDLVTIPVVKKGTVTNESFRLPDVEYTKFDAEENEFTISLPAAHHVIRGAFFESSDAFDAFKSTFK